MRQGHSWNVLELNTAALGCRRFVEHFQRQAIVYGGLGFADVSANSGPGFDAWTHCNVAARIIYCTLLAPLQLESRWQRAIDISTVILDLDCQRVRCAPHAHHAPHIAHCAHHAGTYTHFPRPFCEHNAPRVLHSRPIVAQGWFELRVHGLQPLS